MLLIRKLSLFPMLLSILLVLNFSLIPEASGFEFCQLTDSCEPDTGEPVDECTTLLNPGGFEGLLTGLCKIFGLCEEIMLEVKHAPEINLSKYQTIAFTKFEGDYGDAFAAAYKEQVQRNSHLKVVDRTQLEKLMAEQGISDSDLFNTEMRVKLGNLLPAGLLVTGKVEGSFQHSPRINPQVIPCPYDVEKRCMKNTIKGIATMKGTISIIDVETGQQIKDKRLYAKTEDSNTSLNQLMPDPIDPQVLQETNLQSLVQKLARATIPTTENRSVVLYTDSDLRKLELGILKAKGGRLDDAEKYFAEAIEEAQGNPDISIKTLSTARYDLAVLKVYRGKYSEAENILNQVMEDTLDEFPVPILLKVMDCLKEEDTRRQAQEI